MEIPAESVTRHCGSRIAAGSVPWAFMRMSGVKSERLTVCGARNRPFSRALGKTCLHLQGTWRRGRSHVERNDSLRINFVKSVLAVLACAACLWASTNPGAVAEASTGLELARQGKYELAIPHYRAAIALDPHLPGIYLNLGLAYFKLSKLREAASALEQAIKADPTSFQARVLLGMSYYGSRRFDAAAAATETCGRAAAREHGIAIQAGPKLLMVKTIPGRDQ